MYEKIVLITRKTRLQELVERFNSRRQAQFYIEHAGGSFEDYASEDEQYRRALDTLHTQLSVGLKLQMLERAFLPTYLFTEKDLLVPLGQDGLVANTAKYAGAQPIVAVNPDPGRFDGILLPFQAPQARTAVARVLDQQARVREVTLAEASLSDGQRLLAFNELFIGVKSHVSIRYRIKAGGREEPQSSSGILVATGAGSTGWMSSVFNMASGIATFTGVKLERPAAMAWEDQRLMFAVREPFLSKHSLASLVMGWVEPGSELVLESLTPSGGVIFSDGIEEDFLAFNSGAKATIRAAGQRAKLVVG